MTWVLFAGTAMLFLAALLVLARMTWGPTMLDRAISFDVIVSIAVCALGLEAAVNLHGYTLPLLAALSLLGFISSTGIASFTRGAEPDEADR